MFSPLLQRKFLPKNQRNEDDKKERTDGVWVTVKKEGLKNATIALGLSLKAELRQFCLNKIMQCVAVDIFGP